MLVSIPPYLPFLDGKYTTAPGLSATEKAIRPHDRLIFQLDKQYAHYLESKERCRNENIHKYYHHERLSSVTLAAVNRVIIRRLIDEYPTVFQLNGRSLSNNITGKNLTWADDWTRVEDESYIDGFDALAMQVQEDLVICQLQEEREWMAAIHLCSPNHWDPADKIGQSFATVHSPVPGMEKTLANYFKMLQTAVQKGPFTRFAWGLSTDQRLNHHPLPPPGYDGAEWNGRSFDENSVSFYLRVERQTLVGIPEVNAFLFTIRTYFYPHDVLESSEREALLAAVGSMSEASLRYKGLMGALPHLQRILE